LARLPLVATALADVEQVRNDAAGQEGIAVIVEVNAPRVAGAVGEDLEFLLDRMIAPDAGVDRRALLGRRAGLADERVGKDAVAAVEPAIGAPDERVERLMSVLIPPTIEDDLRRPSGFVLAVLDGDEQQFGRLPDPDPAKADLETADQVESLTE